MKIKKVIQNPKIVLKVSTKKILDKLGKKNDTYDDIINRILDRIGVKR